MKTKIVNALAIVAIITGLAWPSLYLASWLADLGAFGTCREGNCAYGALFIGLPVIWIALSGLGIWGWFRLRRTLAASRG